MMSGLLLRLFTSAHVAHADVKTLMAKISTLIINPIIMLLFAVAFLLLITGVVEYLGKPDDEESRDKGKRHMLWAIIGMFIMISVFGIMQLLINSLGLTGPSGPIDLHNQ